MNRAVRAFLALARGTLVALPLVLTSHGWAAVPGATRSALQLEYQAGIAGGTPDLRVAVAIGISLDRRFDGWCAGLGLGLLRGTTPAGQEVWGVDWGAHGRRFFLTSRWRPYLEAGFGVHMFDIERSPEPDTPQAFAGVGLSAGTGVEILLSAENSLRCGVAYHATRFGRDARGHYQAELGVAFHPRPR